MTGEAFDNQNKDIEIERLKTTCMSLNHQISIVDQYSEEISMLKRRLEESEKIRKLQQQQIDNFEVSTRNLEHTR